MRAREDEGPVASPRARRWSAVLSAALAVYIATWMPAAPLALAAPVAAAGEINVADLTLEEAIALALARSPKLHEARARVALARLDVRASRWWNWLLPRVTTHQGFDFLTGQERASVALSLDLSKLLGEGPRAAERAQIELDSAERGLETVRTEVALEVTKSFFHLTSTKAAFQVREEAVAQALKLEALQAIKFAHGSVDLGPLLQAREALARARLELLRAEHEVRLAELGLRRAMGLGLP